MIAQDLVILVNENDQEIGSMEKMEAHEKGVLHRAFSVFVFNDHGELLLQQRALNKYHSAGLWSNTCCSHPYIGEDITDAAHRRLQEEMGIQISLKELYSFIYHAPFENGLIEHEFDHVFVGHFNEAPIINKEEVNDWKFVSIENLLVDLNNNPENYSVWFRIALPTLLEKLNN